MHSIWSRTAMKWPKLGQAVDLQGNQNTLNWAFHGLHFSSPDIFFDCASFLRYFRNPHIDFSKTSKWPQNGQNQLKNGQNGKSCGVGKN